MVIFSILTYLLIQQVQCWKADWVRAWYQVLHLEYAWLCRWLAAVVGDAPCLGGPSPFCVQHTHTHTHATNSSPLRIIISWPVLPHIPPYTFWFWVNAIHAHSNITSRQLHNSQHRSRLLKVTVKQWKKITTVKIYLNL